MMAAVASSSGTPTAPAPPPAARSTASAWRDPRLWVGVAIVAVSVVAGARLLAAADDTVQVWAVADDMGAGDRVGEEDLVAERVRFADEQRLGGYFTVDEELPADLELSRGVGAGELLPRAAVGSAGESGRLELPLAVDPEQVPPSVGPGAVVDVYVVTSAPGVGGRAPETVPALTEATVLDAPEQDAGLATSGKRQLVLAVEEADAARWFELVAATESPVLTVVRRG